MTKLHLLSCFLFLQICPYQLWKIMQLHSEPIYIIGSGAIGKALAVFLRLAGRKATLIRGSVDGAAPMIQPIRVQTPDGAVHEAEITISSLDAFPTLEGIVVLANKSFGNEKLAEALKKRVGHSPLVLLQNGLGVEKPFLESGFLEIYRCVLFVTSQAIDDATIRFKPVAPCPIGIVRGEADHLQRIVRLLNTPSFEFKSKVHIGHTIWKKAIINCIFNSICPLLAVDNGIFHRDEGALNVARRIIAECVQVAHAQDVFLTPTEIEDTLLQISRSSDGQLISTLQDIRAGRKTEIDTLNFEIARIAEQSGLASAVQETRLLGDLIKMKEELNLKTIQRAAVA